MTPINVVAEGKTLEEIYLQIRTLQKRSAACSVYIVACRYDFNRLELLE